MRPKVFVSGCFDLLHSGHVAFLQEAAEYGALYVAVGSDATVTALKGRPPVLPERERRYLVGALRCVAEAFVATGSGLLDFEPELRRVRPDVFAVNEDGVAVAKEELCRRLGVSYRVLRRRPADSLPERSTTALRTAEVMPYRIDLAGGWLDQPFVSELHPGPVLTLSLEPTAAFDERSGMATSTRRRALELWGPRLPAGDPEQLARLLFCYDNPPGTADVSGSQDALGIVLAGLTRAYYRGGYWPQVIERLRDEATVVFAERSLWLVPLGPRGDGYHPTAGRRLSREGARALAEAAEDCWAALRAHDLAGFGDAVRRSFEAQVALFPNMRTPAVAEAVERYRRGALGWKLSGAGGGGYLVLVTADPPPEALAIRARREAP